MATLLQEELAEAIVKNKSLPRYKRKNKAELVKSVGYSSVTAEKKAGEIIDNKGVQEALAKYGLTEELVTTALVNDIKEKPRKRFLELSLGAEILGMKKKQQEPTSLAPVTNNFVQIVINPPNAQDTTNQPDA